MNTYTYVSLYVVHDRAMETDSEQFEPSFHTSYEDAFEEIWGFVSTRILDCYFDGYAEKFMSDEDESDIEEHLAALCPVVKEDVIEWYFDVEDDAHTQAFYYIKEIAA